MAALHIQPRLFNPNKENAVPTKTPGGLKRVLGQSHGAGAKTAGPRTTGKVPQAGPSTVYRDFNVLNTGKRDGAQTGGKGMMGREGGGKEAGTPSDIAPKRLFAQQLPQPSLRPSRSFTSFAPPPTARKTGNGPARDMATPHASKIAPHATRTPAPAAAAPLQLIATPLPSATRRRRSRHSNTPGSDAGGLGLGSSRTGEPTGPSGQSYMTPPRQLHADGSFELGDESFDGGANVSGGSLGVGSAGLLEVAEEEESDGEIEYMPPKVVPMHEDLFEPLFTAEEVAQIGAQMRNWPRLGQWPEEPGEVPAPIPMDEEATILAGGWDPSGESYKLGIELEEDRVWAAWERNSKIRLEKKREAAASAHAAKAVRPAGVRPGLLDTRPIRPSPLGRGVPAGSAATKSAPRAPANRPTSAFPPPNCACRSPHREHEARPPVRCPQDAHRHAGRANPPATGRRQAASESSAAANPSCCWIH